MENIPLSKQCSKCGNTKSSSCFYRSKTTRDKLTSRCNSCLAEIARKWAKENPQKDRDSHKKWRQKNIERVKRLQKIWDKSHPDQLNEKQRRWRRKNPEYYNIWMRRKNKTVRGNLDNRMHCGVYNSLHRNKNGKSWESLVGYTLNDLKAHLEKLFADGMSWNNMGEWHIDHIVAKSRFHYENPEDKEFRICWGLANLQPMWAHDNHTKHTKTMNEWEQYKTQIGASGAPPMVGGAGTSPGGLPQ